MDVTGNFRLKKSLSLRNSYVHMTLKKMTSYQTFYYLSSIIEFSSRTCTTWYHLRCKISNSNQNIRKFAKIDCSMPTSRTWLSPWSNPILKTRPLVNFVVWILNVRKHYNFLSRILPKLVNSWWENTWSLKGNRPNFRFLYGIGYTTSILLDIFHLPMSSSIHHLNLILVAK